MKKPLNFAILKYMTTFNAACTEDVLCALKDGYSSFRAFNKSDVLNALWTAEANGLLEESRYDLDDEGQVRMFFRAHAEGAATINRYISN